MYLRHFGLEHRPFTITPDPRFLYLSERHREALAHLLYGVGEGGGFVLLTGEVGTGKTTLCRSLLEQLPENVDAALVINPSLGADELLGAICDELGIRHPKSCVGQALRDRLNDRLLAAHADGRRTVLIIDEAQLLGPEALEQVRLLTNLETHTDKLLQVILVGQPELRELLAQPGLRQLAQRITARYHLEPLDPHEVDAYIDHRLQLAGATGMLFTTGAKRRLHRASSGIPRLVNSLADRALLGAFAQGVSRVDTRIATRAAAEVLGLPARGRGWPAWAGVALVVCAGVAGWFYATVVDRPGPALAAQDGPVTPPPEPVTAPPRDPDPSPAAGGPASMPATGPATSSGEASASPPVPGSMHRPEAESVTAQDGTEPRPTLQAAAVTDTVAISRSDAGSATNHDAGNGSLLAAMPVVERDAEHAMQPAIGPVMDPLIARRPASGVLTDERGGLGTQDPAPEPTGVPAGEPGSKAPPPPVGEPLAGALFESRETALARLAELWGSPAHEVAPDCATQPSTGLGCFTAQGAWAALRALDRPALLTLNRVDGELAYAALAGADGERLTLLTPDGERREVARDALLVDWYGRFELLWETPGTRLLQPGSRGPAIAWLRARLPDAASPAPDPALFDPELAARVLAFQQANDLVPDGLVGPQTMIKLDLLAGPGPRLAVRD